MKWVLDLYTIFVAFIKNQSIHRLFAKKLFELFKELYMKVRLRAIDNLEKPFIFAYSETCTAEDR
jgi:hypothetical protein